MGTAGGLLLDRVCKTFAGGVRAVVDLSLDAAASQCLVLFGPSGCGKTTTLRLIAGLEETTSGDVVIDGQIVTRFPPHRRGVALVTQEHDLYPHLTARENVCFGLAHRPDAAWLARVAEGLGIAGLLDRLPEALSGGQRQRVALARALVRRRRVTLLDEPLSNIEEPLRLAIRRQIKELTRDTETVLVYVTHDQREALALADRLAVMDSGRLMQIGPPSEVYARPSTRGVAQSLSPDPVTFIRTVVDRGEGGCVIYLGGLSIPCNNVSLGPLLGRQVCLGIRPDCLSLAEGNIEGSLSARVIAIEEQGDSRLAYLLAEPTRAANPEPFELVARLDGRSPVATGQHLNVTLLVERLLWFDEAGNRLAGIDDETTTGRARPGGMESLPQGS